MYILLANVIRSFSEVVAYTEKNDRILQLMLEKNMEPDSKSGGKPVLDQLDSLMSGISAAGATKEVSAVKEIKKHLTDSKFNKAVELYKKVIVPYRGKPFGRI